MVGGEALWVGQRAYQAWVGWRRPRGTEMMRLRRLLCKVSIIDSKHVSMTMV